MPDFSIFGYLRTRKKPPPSEGNSGLDFTGFYFSSSISLTNSVTAVVLVASEGLFSEISSIGQTTSGSTTKASDSSSKASTYSITFRSIGLNESISSADSLPLRDSGMLTSLAGDGTYSGRSSGVSSYRFFLFCSKSVLRLVSEGSSKLKLGISIL